VLGDDVGGGVRGHRLVMVELDGVDAAPLRHRTQVSAVAHDLGERHRGAHDRAVVLLFHPQHAPATGVEVAHHVTHVLVGHDHLDDVNWLQQDWVGSLEGQLEDLAPGGLEGDVLRVDGVFLAVEDDGLDIHDGVAGDDAILQHGSDTLFNRRIEGIADGPAEDFTLEFIARRLGTARRADAPRRTDPHRPSASCGDIAPRRSW
jgi:hypothetical protein